MGWGWVEGKESCPQYLILLIYYFFCQSVTHLESFSHFGYSYYLWESSFLLFLFVFFIFSLTRYPLSHCFLFSLFVSLLIHSSYLLLYSPLSSSVSFFLFFFLYIFPLFSHFFFTYYSTLLLFISSSLNSACLE